jgi:hypothetical protein
MPRKKMCSNPPVVFSQAAINILYHWFPDSNGNLDAEDVWDAIMGHWSDDDMSVCAPNKAGEELVDKVENILKATSKDFRFSPVLD